MPRRGTNDPGASRPAYAIGSVDKVLALIALVALRGTVRVTDAATALGVARSTASRLFDMLAFHGFVVQDEVTRAYAIGESLRALAGRATADDALRACARPHVERLVARLGETVLVTRMEGSQIRVIDSVECAKTLRVTSRTGAVMPAHATAAGKVLLAAMTRAELLAHLPAERLAPTTPHTLTSRSVLLRQLEAVRRRGYAVTVGENEENVHAVGLAIVDAAGVTRASLSLVAPDMRLRARQFPSVAAELRAAADRIGRELPPAPA